MQDRMVGAPNSTAIPPPLVEAIGAALPMISQLAIVGLADSTRIPPPLPEATPPVTVKPSSTDWGPSPEKKVTTDPEPPPLMMVWDGPPVLRSVIALPWKLIRSMYVPGATSTVAPF